LGTFCEKEKKLFIQKIQEMLLNANINFQKLKELILNQGMFGKT